MFGKGDYTLKTLSGSNMHGEFDRNDIAAVGSSTWGFATEEVNY